MTHPTDYPLAQVLDVKKRRVDEQERVVKQKKQALKEEENKLIQAEKERDKVKQHYQDKLQQLRDYTDSEGMKPEKVLQMKSYIKLVKENLEEEEQKVLKQKDSVEAAKKQVEEAIQLLKQREHEVEKLNMHRKEWEAIVKKEIERAEANEQDEIGNLLFLKRMRDAEF